jgi:hypothetical protein
MPWMRNLFLRTENRFKLNTDMFGNPHLNSADEHLDVIAVLYAPFEKYLNGLIPLMLEHIWKRKNKRGSSYFEELMHTGWLCRLITLDKRVLDPFTQEQIAGWGELKSQIITNFENCRTERDLDKMIQKNSEQIFPVINKRFDSDYSFPQREFGCWWYTVHDDETHVAVHLINAYQPQSPFRQLEHFVRTLFFALEDAVSKFPSLRKVSCGSWLNNLPKFQWLWPKEFTSTQKILNADGGFGPGAWGQYMTQTGDFHSENAARLKQTMKHPYPLTEASCLLEELHGHLHNLISRFAKDQS